MQPLGLLLDLVIVAGLIQAGWRGQRLGLMRVVFDLAGLLIATVAAFLAFRSFSPLLQRIHLSAILAPVLAFVLIWILIELGYTQLRRHLRINSHAKAWKKPFAALLSGLSFLVMASLAVMVLEALPAPAAVKTAIEQSRISSLMLTVTDRWQTSLEHLIDRDLSNLNFFTTEKTDNETIQLGFKVTNGQVRPDLENRMLVLVNEERANRGLKALTMDDRTREVARRHSQDMLARGYFSHLTPEGLDPFARMRAGGLVFYAAGENLALAPSLPLAHNGLMNSPPHRANILEPSFHHVGIGIIDAGRYGLVVTQDFTN